MHSRFITRRLPEQLQSAGKSQVWVLAAQHGSRNRGEFFGNNDRRCCGCSGGAGVFGIRDESKLAGSSFLDSRDTSYIKVSGAVFQTCAKRGGDLSKFHRGSSSVARKARPGIRQGLLFP